MQTASTKPASAVSTLNHALIPFGIAASAGILVYLASDAESKIAIALLASSVTLVGTLAFWVAVNKLTAAWNGRHKGETVSAHPCTAIVLYKDGHFARIVHDKSYTLAKDESAKLIDLRHAHAAWSAHTCMSADRVKITLHPCAIWQVSSAEAFMRHAIHPHKILEQTVLAALTSAIGRRRFEQIAGNIDAMLIEANGMARAALTYYGIQLHAIQVARIELPEPSPKSEGQKEADFIDALNKVVPNANASTMAHAQRIIELKLASAREATAKKD
jgi:hypothetical protein